MMKFTKLKYGNQITQRNFPYVGGLSLLKGMLFPLIVMMISSQVLLPGTWVIQDRFW